MHKPPRDFIGTLLLCVIDTKKMGFYYCNKPEQMHVELELFKECIPISHSHALLGIDFLAKGQARFATYTYAVCAHSNQVVINFL